MCWNWMFLVNYFETLTRTSWVWIDTVVFFSEIIIKVVALAVCGIYLPLSPSLRIPEMWINLCDSQKRWNQTCHTRKAIVWLHWPGGAGIKQTGTLLAARSGGTAALCFCGSPLAPWDTPCQSGVKSLSAALFSFSARVFFPWDCLWVSVWGCTTETFHRSHHILSFLFLYSVSCGWFSVFLFFSTTLAKVFILVSLVCRQGALFPCLPMYSKVSFRQYALLPVLTVQNVEVFWSMCSLYLWMSKQQHFYFLR